MSQHSHEPQAANTHCLEIAVYDVRADALDSFPDRQAAMHAILQTQPGFMHGERLRGLSTPTLFADYITWASREAAESAAARMPAMPEAGPFMAAIERMRTFAHLPVTAPTTDVSGP
jgi:hypothetical protein